MEFQGPRINQTTIDGIPTFWVPGPRPFTASLSFRVGQFDEPYVKRGTTHLVEHLAMVSNQDAPVAVNAAVTPHITSFWAQGHPHEVAKHLRNVCRTLVDLPYERIDIEAGVLQQEAVIRGHPYLFPLLWAYFGPFGPGLLGEAEHALPWVTEREVEEWVQRYFTRENAALTIFGKAPETMGLELPGGEPMRFGGAERIRPAPEEPTLFGSSFGGVSWGTLVSQPKSDGDPALGVAHGVLTERMTRRIRHELGKTYDVSSTPQRIDRHLILFSHGFGCDPTFIAQAGEEHLDVINTFIDEGPTEEEIEKSLDRFISAFDDFPFETAQNELKDEAETHLAGFGPRSSLEDWVNAWSELTPDRVRERFAEAYRQSYTFAALPDGVLAPLTDTLQFAPSPLAGFEYVATFQDPPGAKQPLRVGETGIGVQYAEGWLNTEWDEVAVVRHDFGNTSVAMVSTTVTIIEEASNPGSLANRARNMQLVIAALVAVAGAIASNAGSATLGFGCFVIAGLLALRALIRSSDPTVLRDPPEKVWDAIMTFVPSEKVLPPPRPSADSSGQPPWPD